MSLKLEPIAKFNFVGDDFTGNYEQDRHGIGDRFCLSLGLGGASSYDPNTKEFQRHANATFYAVASEEEIDRIAAAAKIVWRELQKLPK